jgi:hypothetical protein
MPARVNEVHGELLHWARQQQQFTMRWIHQHGGPSPAYQSEVGNGCKAQVQLLIGEHPMLQRHLRAVCDLTLIPDTFFLHGEMGVEMYLLEGYLPAVRLADKEGIAPEELLSLVTSVSNMLRSRSKGAPHAESCHSDRVTAFLSKTCSL